ncbi:MAG: hypothetical protein DID92_2727743994 [Candidatus Nitrotoga sp. SPKER]|nr:MAG: hypothetical protein DID92_2727743994 [Candidatus Nitrotoga sp. SPKER]
MTVFLTEHWIEIEAFFNSVFFTSIAGAFAGAYGAQRIAERSKYREQMLKEMRDTNAAIMIAFGICNSLLSVKKQHVKSLKEDFDFQKAALLEHHKKVNIGQISRDEIFDFRTDLMTLSLPPLPVDILQGQLFEKLSLVGRPLSLATTLSQSVHSLNASLEKRNQLIDVYKASGGVTPVLYFGLPHNNQTDANYPSVIDAIFKQADDIIFFSQLLCKDLSEHGNQLAKQFKTKFGKGAPKISEPDFSKAEELGLMPNISSYADWLTMFVKAPIKERWSCLRLSKCKSK